MAYTIVMVKSPRNFSTGVNCTSNNAAAIWLVQYIYDSRYIYIYKKLNLNREVLLTQNWQNRGSIALRRFK